MATALYHNHSHQNCNQVKRNHSRSYFFEGAGIRSARIASFLFFLTFITNFFALGQSVTATWKKTASEIYATGFAYQVKETPGGVSLFGMELVENDAYGSGSSEKGIYLDSIWGTTQARKQIYLEDSRTDKAWLVVFVARQGEFPLSLSINGHKSKLDKWDERTNDQYFRWCEFPAQWLKKGNNVIDLLCPEASSRDRGWVVYLSRADEFRDGGGDPKDVGKTSFKSFNGGKTWMESPFGRSGKERAEYTVRISLDRYVSQGWLETPVIDLWRGDNQDFIVPLRMCRKLSIGVSADVPAGTRVEYYLRKGLDPGPFSPEWKDYELAGSGANLKLTLDGAHLNSRFIQVRVVLSTSNPLLSPVVKSMELEATHQENTPVPKNIFVVSADNPPVRYSSIAWEWEKPDCPAFPELRERQNLDEVVKGSTSEFDAQVKLMNHAIKQWVDGGATPGFPDWNALSILDQINKTGGGGMCLQNNLLLAGFYQSYGWQARHVNVVSHEICEVWNNEFAKWIYMDAHRANHYFYDKESGEPMSVLEIHKAYLNKYFPDRQIDWQQDRFSFPPDDHPFAQRGSPTTHGDQGSHNAFNEYLRPAFIRMVPRANWFSKPFPRPLNHGLSQWPWNGYINWYDERTPPQRQYSRFTNRPTDMWPDLNTVHIHADSGYGNDLLYLNFETYTPGFSHFEAQVNGTNWRTVGPKWVWLLQAGKNTLQVRAVNKLGAKGRLSTVVLNHHPAPFGE